MQDNWYEAVVSRQAPHRILSVVDWASDAPVPSEPTIRPLATYNVFSFGINDPSEGDRSIAKENFDPLASPLGWHVIPVANDPLSSHTKKTDRYSNYTTTFGNNVRISTVLFHGCPESCIGVCSRELGGQEYLAPQLSTRWWQGANIRLYL
jgi:Fungalysin metallopeptidase (M36)